MAAAKLCSENGYYRERCAASCHVCVPGAEHEAQRRAAVETVAAWSWVTRSQPYVHDEGIGRDEMVARCEAQLFNHGWEGYRLADMLSSRFHR